MRPCMPSQGSNSTGASGGRRCAVCGRRAPRAASLTQRPPLAAQAGDAQSLWRGAGGEVWCVRPAVGRPLHFAHNTTAPAARLLSAAPGPGTACLPALRALPTVGQCLCVAGVVQALASTQLCCRRSPTRWRRRPARACRLLSWCVQLAAPGWLSWVFYDCVHGALLAVAAALSCGGCSACSADVLSRSQQQ